MAPRARHASPKGRGAASEHAKSSALTDTVVHSVVEEAAAATNAANATDAASLAEKLVSLAESDGVAKAVAAKRKREKKNKGKKKSAAQGSGPSSGTSARSFFETTDGSDYKGSGEEKGQASAGRAAAADATRTVAAAADSEARGSKAGKADFLNDASSDEEEVVGGLALGVGAATREGKRAAKKAAAKAKGGADPDVERKEGCVVGGVIYIGHIPHGFYEEEMQAFFKQFGTVTRVKVIRSFRTARSKGYGFVEFEVPDVAAIVADTMNNYMLFNKTMVSHVVTVAKLHEGLFKGWNTPVTRSSGRITERRAYNFNKDGLTKEAMEARVVSQNRTATKRKTKLSGAGYDVSYLDLNE